MKVGLRAACRHVQKSKVDCEMQPIAAPFNFSLAFFASGKFL
jgi:hypothetical protein